MKWNGWNEIEIERNEMKWNGMGLMGRQEMECLIGSVFLIFVCSTVCFALFLCRLPFYMNESLLHAFVFSCFREADDG